MTRIVGIIPAGGEASRFRGLRKELLPVSQTDCALTRCIASMKAGGADSIIVATKPRFYKLQEFANVPGVHFICNEFEGLWDALTVAAVKEADWYYFAMPDTVYPLEAFMAKKTHPVMVGTFQTAKPERFGMLRGLQIVDKQPGEAGRAWGTWIFSADAMKYLTDRLYDLRDHTAALNALLTVYPFGIIPLDYYYDFAQFSDYVEFLCSAT